MSSELEQLRQESEQLKNQIRVSKDEGMHARESADIPYFFTGKYIIGIYKC